MAQAPALENIDSLPYPALQAEAAKYSLRRNLGAVKLRQALKQILGSNPDLSSISAEWFIVSANSGSANPGRAVKTKKAPIAGASGGPPARRYPVMTRRRRAKNTPLPSSLNALSTPAPHVTTTPPISPFPEIVNQSNQQSPSPRRTNWATQRDSSFSSHAVPTDRHAPDSIPRSLPTYSEIFNLASRQSAGFRSPHRVSFRDDGANLQSSNERSLPRGSGNNPPSTPPGTPPGTPPSTPPEFQDQRSYPSSEDFRRALRHEAARLGLQRGTNEQNISFLDQLVRHTLEQIDRGNHISCSLRISYDPIDFDIPGVSPSGKMHIYQNQVIMPSPKSQVVPWSTVDEYSPGEAQRLGNGMKLGG